MGWLTGWIYQKEVTLVEQSSGAYSDYPTIITAAYDAHMKSDFADCRFTESDGTTLIPYGIVDKTDDVSCTFVIKRDYTSGCSLTVYLYYGKADAADASVDHGPWALAWYLANGFGQSSSAPYGSCTVYRYSASEDIPAWADVIFGGCTANGAYRTYGGRVKINGVAVEWASTAVCNGITVAYQLKWKKYNCADSQYDHGSFVAGASNTVTWGHNNAGDPGFWVSYYPTDPSVSLGSEIAQEAVDLIAKFEVGQNARNLPAEFVVGQWQENLHAQFDVQQETSGDLPAFFEVDHILDLPAQFVVRNVGLTILLGMFDVGQNAEDLKATFDGQVSLNLPAHFEVYRRRADLKAQFTTRQSIPGPVVFGPILIEAATSDAVRFPFQRKSFYALDRTWMFYTDGTNIRFSSSKDGFRWKAPETVRAGVDGEDFSVVEQNGYVHYAYASNLLSGDLYYRRGLLALDGSISWDPEQTAQSTTKYIQRPFIGIDSTDHPWIGYRWNLGSSGASYKIKFRSSSTNDGTWSTDADLEYIDTVFAQFAGSVSPVSGNRMHIFYCYDNGDLFTHLWDGSIGGYTRLGQIRHRLAHSVTSVDDVVYVVLQRRTTNNLVFRKWDGSWGSEVIIQSSLSDIAPAICAIDANELYVFYVDGAMIKYFKSEDAGATWTGPVDLKDVPTIPSYWEFNVFSNSGSPIIGIPVTVGTDASFILYDLDWAPRLHASFFVNQWQEDLHAEFIVAQWQEDLPAQLEVGQGSEELPAEFVIRHTATPLNLGAEFEVGQGAADLPAQFEVGQGSEDLLGAFVVRQETSVDLPAEFIVAQWQLDLPARFRVMKVYDLRGTAGIAFYWQGADNPPESIVDFTVESATGFWVAEFYDGPASLRYVFIPWTQFRETGIDGTRPDLAQVDGFICIVHTSGLRRIDYIHAPFFGNLHAFFTTRHAAAVDLAAGFTSQAVRDLPAEFTVRHPPEGQGFNDLNAQFYVEMSLLPGGGLWDYQYVWQNLAAELEIGTLQGQIEVDPATRAITARTRHAINDRTIVTMCGGYRAYSKGTFTFDAEASAYGGVNPVYTPAFGLVENKHDFFAGGSAHAAMLYTDGAGVWYFYTEDDGDTEGTLLAGIDFTAQHTFKIVWEDATEYPATGRVRLWIDDVLKTTHIVAVPTNNLLFFLLMESYIVAHSADDVWTKLHSFSVTGDT